MNAIIRAIPSPCVGICVIDDAGLCEGCHRSLAEIASWLQLSDAQRTLLMDEILPQREARRA